MSASPWAKELYLDKPVTSATSRRQVVLFYVSNQSHGGGGVTNLSCNMSPIHMQGIILNLINKQEDINNSLRPTLETREAITNADFSSFLISDCDAFIKGL